MRSFFDVNLGYPHTGARGSLVPSPSDWVDARVLAAGVAEVHGVPAEAVIVLFSATGDFFAKFGTSSGVVVAVPSADVTDGSSGILNPTSRGLIAVGGGPITHIALIAPAACIVTLEFYKA